MADDNPPPIRARRWSRPQDSAKRSSPFKSYRFAARLIGIPVLAVAAELLYRGGRDRVGLPLPDGATVAGDYSSLWQGNTANTKYAVVRKAAGSSAITPAHSPRRS